MITPFRSVYLPLTITGQWIIVGCIVPCFISFHLSSLSLQIGLPGFDSMPVALKELGREERSTFCNDHWQKDFKKARQAQCIA